MHYYTPDPKWNGIFPHECEEPGCTKQVQFDDEPKCFDHSPDEGSSVKGYSARLKAEAHTPRMRRIEVLLDVPSDFSDARFEQMRKELENAAHFIARTNKPRPIEYTPDPIDWYHAQANEVPFDG